MSRTDMSSSRAPRPSRRRGGRVRLKAEEGELRAAPIVSSWLQMITEIVGEQAMHEGMLAARDGAVRSLSLESGAVAGPVQADAESSLPVRINLPLIDDAGWDRIVQAMACEAVWAAKLLEGVVPQGLEDLFRGCGTPLIPDATHAIPEVERGGRREGWRVAALAWVAGDRLLNKPLAFLEVRGQSCELLVERIGHHRALRTQGETMAHPPVLLETSAAAGPPLVECLETWWRSRGGVHEVDRATHARHALLRRLGPSTLEGRFPLSGLLATIYDETAQEAARVLDTPLDTPSEDSDRS